MKSLFSRIFSGKYFSSKYIEIIFAVALFIVLDTGVLTINFYTSYQIANDAQAIQVANRQTILSQNMLHELYRLRDDAQAEGVDYQPALDRLEETYKTFDETMDAFIYGGELIGVGQGADALLKDDAYRKANEETLKKSADLWQLYRIQVKSVAYAYFNNLSREDIVREANEAIAFARENNPAFYELLTAVAHSMKDVAQQKAERLRLIQTIGIGLAVLNFFLILFHFLRKLRQSDALVEKAQRETTEILANVNEGLLLLDRNFLIGSQYSASLKDIFRRDDFAGQNLFELLKPMVTAKTLGVARDYVDILFSQNVAPALVLDLNPLSKVEINLARGEGDFVTLYLSFEFSRVMEGEKLVCLLVTVSDITDRVQLKLQLKRAEEKAAQDMEMLLQVIHLDGALLLDYLVNVQKSLMDVNALLKQPAKSQPQFMDKILRIARIVHTLKGECTSLDLGFIEAKLHDYESVLATIKNNEKLSGADLIPLAVRLNQLMSDVHTVQNLVQKMNGSQDMSAAVASPLKPVTGSYQSLSTLEVWKPQFEHLVAQVAKDHHKAVKLTLDGCSLARINPVLRDAMRDVVIQCLRNAVVHGLELPSVRSAQGKNVTGHVKVCFEQEGNAVVLKIRDDGKGIDVEAIRETAIRQGLYPRAKLVTWQPNQLIKLIFQPGFSTVVGEGTDRHAGRGVGLDAVKAILDQHRGKMGISYRTGEYTEFRFRFELSAHRTAIAAIA